MAVERGTGNLLEANTDAIVNTVNTVGVMGKGVALQFRQAFPENYKAYRRAFERDELAPGRMLIFETGTLSGPKYIINFPTKRHWRQDSRLEDIESGLIDLAREVRARKIRSIALPPLGCGNGGLDWSVVRPRIIEALGAIPDLRVVLFEPGNAPAPEEMIVATKKPKITANRAALVELIRRYREADYRQTKIEVQKSAYFLQVAGQPLNLGWVQHNFGPYAEKLNHVLRDLEGHYIRGVGDRSRDSSIHVLEERMDDVERFLALDRESGDRVALVRDLIARYEFPYGMELLATVHWVATHDLAAAASARGAIKLVHAWNARKAEWPEHDILVAWKHLAESGWLERRLQ